MSVTGSNSEQAKSARKGRFFLGCFFTLFMLFGLACSLIFLISIVDILKARGWSSAPCTILASRVASQKGNKGGYTYSIEVSYRYRVDGQSFESSRYKFMGGSSSGESGKQEIVDQLKPGSQAVCYYDPNDPSQSVLERGFTADLWFGLIPLVFALVGAGGLVGVVVRKDKDKEKKVPKGASQGISPPGPGPVTLRPKTSPATRLGCTIGFALFWNGVVSIFLFEVIDGWRHGRSEGCTTVFLIPFVGIGLGAVGMMVYYFLALFNPRPVLKLSTAVAAMGETIELEWETEGSVDRVKTFVIALEGREEATYRNGKSNSTDRSVFATLELAKSKGRDFRRGKVKVEIPVDTMHSFAGKHNKIVWCFKVKGDIPRWPDVDEEFAFEVLPQKLMPGNKTA